MQDIRLIHHPLDEKVSKVFSTKPVGIYRGWGYSEL